MTNYDIICKKRKGVTNIIKEFIIDIVKNPYISFVANIIGIFGGLLGVFSHFDNKKLKNKIINNKRINNYNTKRETIKNKIGAIQIILMEEANVNNVLIENEISILMALLESYQDIISNKKLKKYIKNIKRGKNRIEYLEKIKLICEEEELVI